MRQKWLTAAQKSKWCNLAPFPVYQLSAPAPNPARSPQSRLAALRSCGGPAPQSPQPTQPGQLQDMRRRAAMSLFVDKAAPGATLSSACSCGVGRSCNSAGSSASARSVYSPAWPARATVRGLRADVCRRGCLKHRPVSMCMSGSALVTVTRQAPSKSLPAPDDRRILSGMTCACSSPCQPARPSCIDSAKVSVRNQANSAPDCFSLSSGGTMSAMVGAAPRIGAWAVCNLRVMRDAAASRQTRQRPL